MTRDEALSRTNLADLLEAIGRDRGLTPQGKTYPCPDVSHEQTGASPQTTIAESSDGYEVWNCHRCEKGGTALDALVVSGRARDIADALTQLGVEKQEAPARRRPQVPAREVCTYRYVDEGGAQLYEVVRFEPKTFRQRRWEGGRWQWGLADTRRVLYRLPEVREALARNQVLFVVEGEKDADALWDAGFAATTCAMGAGKWDDGYTASLVGTSHKVIVVADDDEAGHKHAADVWRRLTGKVGQVIARLPAEGFKDVSDQLAAGVAFTSKSLRPLPLVSASPEPPDGAAPGPIMLTARAMSARPSLGVGAQVVGPLFQRGMRTVIGAGTGEGKTTFSLQAIRALVHNEPFLDWRPQKPGRALIIDLEQGEEVVKRRLAEAHLDDSEAVDVLWEPSGMALDQDPVHQALVRDTVRDGGYDLVLIDPLYQMHRGSGNDEELAASLMNVVDAWAREFGFALVIPMHARKPHPEAKKRMLIHDIAGVGGWLRNAEFVLGLQVMSAGNSRVHFFKDRVGDGPDLQSHWFLSFDRQQGFARSHVEEMQARRAEWNEMLARSEGVTLAELSDAGADLNFIKRVKAKCHIRGERWRAIPWHEQTALDTEGAVLSTGDATDMA